ncbi:MAG: toll/interleukin-1 receptor domain-containing protein [Bryobacteraceae bacterium]
MTSIPENRKQERFWNQLIGIISKGGVVPIVGEDLLRLPGDQGQNTLYELLAMRYASSCDIVLDPAQQGNLSAVIRHHPDFASNPHDVYGGLGEEYEACNPAIPEPLLALARIRHFNLFVTTTFDDLLERALNEERFGGKKRTEVITYSPKSVPDDKQISTQLATGRPVVFQLFGNCRIPLKCALTEGDKVEYMHALQTAEYRPNRIFSELYDRPLLLLGNRFPDWLTRMFLRMVRKTPLDHREVPKQYVSDARVVEDAYMRFFLHNFATNTEVVEDLDPVELVMELSKRWLERFGNQDIEPVTAPAAGPRAMPKNAVFISYCATDSSGRPSRDGQIAAAIRDALEARGIDVWFDKDQLQGGDEFERRIKRYVETCSLFMPLISETTQSRDDGFFRKEWNWALSKLSEFTGSDRQFLFPMVIDEINPYKAKVPEEFKRFQFTPILGSTPDPQFLNRVQWLYEKARTEV